MKAVICDVGHTIITDSILNKILLHQGKENAAMKLYDEKILTGKTQVEIDQWVEKISCFKVNSLQGLTLDEIESYCQNASITSGLTQFITELNNKDIPMLFIGAVPIVITTLLLKAAGVTRGSHNNVYIDGSTLQLANNKIVKPIKVCTPGLKKIKAQLWAESLDIDFDELIIIGDSIGDVPVMELAAKDNRYGIHVNSSILMGMINREVKDFTEFLHIVENKLNDTAELI